MDYKAVRNLATMFFDQADALGDKPFLWDKHAGAWRPRSYAETASQITRLARGLRSLGIEKGDRVVIVSENRPDWVVADVAIGAIGAISVPAYTTNTTDDHLYILEHSEAKIAIVSTERLARNVLPAARSAGTCDIVISMEPPPSDTQAGVRSLHWDDVLAMGDELQDDIRATAGMLTREDVACFIYTSGTGGRPKGVMLTHGSILANCYSAYDLLLELGLGDEVFLSLLPLSHSYEHTCGLFFPISIGAQIYYAEGPDKIAQNLQEARPTIMTAVPRLYEVLHDRIRRGVEQAGGAKAKLFYKALDLGRKRHETPGALTIGEKFTNAALDLLVRKKVAGRFGGRLKTFVSGGAALNPDIGNFFLSLGVGILQGYGQTEASPVINCNRPAKIRIETVGPALAGVEVKIAADGEILVRGELLMKGYWRDAETTAETIVDGWLHTGDIGVIEDDGYLKITDRKKDIIVNSGGDNIAPARVEGVITLETEIAQAMVYGDKRPNLVGVVVPSDEFITEWAKANDVEAKLASLCENPDFTKAVGAVMDRVNAKLSQIEKVRRVVIATEAFTTDNAMMTPTLKIRRHKIREAYWEKLDALYGRG
jgi:long-chain acyl-CoA synthetase